MGCDNISFVFFNENVHIVTQLTVFETLLSYDPKKKIKVKSINYFTFLFQFKNKRVML